MMERIFRQISSRFGFVLAFCVLLSATVGARPGSAAILFDTVSVLPMHRLMPTNQMAAGLELRLDGVILPSDTNGPPRQLRIEILRLTRLSKDAAISLSEGELQVLLSSDMNQDGAIGSLMEALDPANRAVVATVCTTLADPANVAAIIRPFAANGQFLVDSTFQIALASLAAECQSSLAEMGTASAGFIHRAGAMARLEQGADALVSLASIDLRNWVGNSTGADMSGTIVTARRLSAATGDPAANFAEVDTASLLWDGRPGGQEVSRVAIYGRVSQYKGSGPGLLDAEDQIDIELKPGGTIPDALGEALAGSSTASLLIADHLLSNLQLLRVLALERTQISGIDVQWSQTDDLKAFWYLSTFALDPAPVTAAVRMELFRRSFSDDVDVAKLQTSLKALGLYDAEVDGKTGPMTRDAFATLERLASGAANGVVSPVEAIALGLKTTGFSPLPRPLPASLADVLTAKSGVSQEDSSRVTADTRILQERIAALESELVAMRAGARPRIEMLEARLEECYCQDGRGCP